MSNTGQGNRPSRITNTLVSGLMLWVAAGAAQAAGVPDYDCPSVWQQTCAPGGQYGGWKKFNFYNDFQKYWRVVVTPQQGAANPEKYYNPVPVEEYGVHGISYNSTDKAIEIDMSRATALKDKSGQISHGYINLEYSNTFEGDFEFITQFRALDGNTGNSGIQFASTWLPASPSQPNRGPEAHEIVSVMPVSMPKGGWMDGPQIDVHPMDPLPRLQWWDRDPGPMRTGLLFDETRTSYQWLTPMTQNLTIGSRVYMREDQALSVLRNEGIHSRTDHPIRNVDDWNTLYIRYEGGKVTTAVNGRIILRDAAPTYSSWFQTRCYIAKNFQCGVSRPGRIAFQIHTSFNPFENRSDWGLASWWAPSRWLMLSSKEQDYLKMQYRGVWFREF